MLEIVEKSMQSLEMPVQLFFHRVPASKLINWLLAGPDACYIVIGKDVRIYFT